MSDVPLLRLRGIEKTYRMPGRDGLEIQALKGLDLDILPAEFVVIMGPSGSGKSTLLQILGLLDRPTAGDLQVEGQSIQNCSEDQVTWIRSRLMGFVFQFFNLLPRTSSRDNVRMPLIYAGRDQDFPKADQLLIELGLGERLDHKPHQLSGGQQQRVAIARALANSPRLILADEPTGNVSSQQATEILDQFERLNQQGITILIVTHEPEVAARARRILTIKDGQIFEDRLQRERTSQNIQQPLAGNPTSVPSAHRQGWGWLWESGRMATVALRLNFLRTLLATLGVLIGIASFTAMMAVGRGAESEFAQQMSQLGTNVLNVRALGNKVSATSATNLRRLLLDDFLALKSFASREPLIKSLDAQVYQDVVLKFENKNVLTEAMGATPTIEQIQSYTPIAGRFFTDLESESRERVVLLGPTVVRELFGVDKNPVGATISLNQTDYRVIGVLPSKGATSFKDRDNLVIVPLETAIYRIKGSRRLTQITVQAGQASQLPQMQSKLEDFFRQRNGLREDQPNNFEILDMADVRAVFESSLGIIQKMLQAIALICLLVGGIGIMNVMFVSVKERTREVGLRKSLGARRLNILGQFLVEAMLIGLLGGISGVAVGALLAAGLEIFLGWKTMLTLTSVLISFTFSLAVGIIFGLWPARQAAALSPIEALRYE